MESRKLTTSQILEMVEKRAEKLAAEKLALMNSSRQNKRSSSPSQGGNDDRVARLERAMGKLLGEGSDVDDSYNDYSNSYGSQNNNQDISSVYGEMMANRRPIPNGAAAKKIAQLRELRSYFEKAIDDSYDSSIDEDKMYEEDLIRQEQGRPSLKEEYERKNKIMESLFVEMLDPRNIDSQVLRDTMQTTASYRQGINDDKMFHKRGVEKLSPLDARNTVETRRFSDENMQNLLISKQIAQHIPEGLRRDPNNTAIDSQRQRQSQSHSSQRSSERQPSLPVRKAARPNNDFGF